MAIVTIDTAKTQKQFDAAQSTINHVLLHDVNWNGATVVIEWGDYTSIDTTDEYAGVALMHKINAAMDAA